MIDHLRIAKVFLSEQLSRRPDIFGALLLGSAARNEATETSDIDLAFYVQDTKGEGSRDIACWRENVYVEAGVVTPEGLSSFREVMENPINATHIRDALLLYDPTGFSTDLQKQVRAHYMDPYWLSRRVSWAIDLYSSSLTLLRDGTRENEYFTIGEAVTYLSHAAASVPFFLVGRTPSSTRQLSFLSDVFPELRDLIIVFECAIPNEHMNTSSIIEICKNFLKESDRKDLGGLPEYMAWKADRMLSNHALRDAVDVLWTSIGLAAKGSSKRPEAARFLIEWFRHVGWADSQDFAEKWNLARRIKEQIESIAKPYTGITEA